MSLEEVKQLKQQRWDINDRGSSLKNEKSACVKMAHEKCFFNAYHSLAKMWYQICNHPGLLQIAKEDRESKQSDDTIENFMDDSFRVDDVDQDFSKRMKMEDFPKKSRIWHGKTLKRFLESENFKHSMEITHAEVVMLKTHPVEQNNWENRDVVFDMKDRKMLGVISSPS